MHLYDILVFYFKAIPARSFAKRVMISHAYTSNWSLDTNKMPDGVSGHRYTSLFDAP